MSKVENYNFLTILLHWLTMVLVIGLFALGLWMGELNELHEWYRRAPHLHASVGIFLLSLTVLRLIWIFVTPKPDFIEGTAPWEQATTAIVHSLLYLLLFLVMISGYLIATADGNGIMVFKLFELPALPWHFEEQKEIAEEIHEFLAFGLIGLMILHMLAALKHHFISNDNTLKRMLGKS